MGDDDQATTVPKRPRPRPTPEATAPIDAPVTELAVHNPPAIVEDGASLAAEHVSLTRSAVGRVEGGEVRVEQGAVGIARVEHLSVDGGVVGGVMADSVEVSRGYARSIIARQVQLDRAAARVVIAAEVTTRQTAVIFLLARRVSGDVRVLFDWRGALAFGAAAGVVVAALSRLRGKRSKA